MAKQASPLEKSIFITFKGPAGPLKKQDYIDDYQCDWAGKHILFNQFFTKLNSIRAGGPALKDQVLTFYVSCGTTCDSSCRAEIIISRVQNKARAAGGFR